MRAYLIEDWRAVLRKAWSIKFSVLAALFSAAEVGMTFAPTTGVRAGTFAAIAIVISLGGALFRLVAQQELSGGGDGASK